MTNIKEGFTMTQEINNREYRQNVIRELLADLHAGKPFEEVKARFGEVFKGVAATEIAEAEQALIREGISVEEITRLCDVHAAVFKGSVEEIHRPANPQDTPGHPAHTLKLENRALERLINERIRPHLDAFLGEGSGAQAEAKTEAETAAALADDLADLAKINIHYTKKEHLFFPYMEQHGITAPPKVMWAVDDEIRNLVKEVARMVRTWVKPSESEKPTKEAIKKLLDETLTKAIDMISKEEDILLPMVLEVFTDDEWKVIADESKEIGYFLISPPPEWKPATREVSEGTA
jgi:DUF438 domain-containing protein